LPMIVPACSHTNMRKDLYQNPPSPAGPSFYARNPTGRSMWKPGGQERQL
jgi:hypothetical protein